jgi:hypothetical protein
MRGCLGRSEVGSVNAAEGRRTPGRSARSGGWPRCAQSSASSPLALWGAGLRPAWSGRISISGRGGRDGIGKGKTWAGPSTRPTAAKSPWHCPGTGALRDQTHARGGSFRRRTPGGLMGPKGRRGSRGRMERLPAGSDSARRAPAGLLGFTILAYHGAKIGW